MEDVELGVCTGRWYAGDPDRVAVVLPGARYLPFAPVLWFAREVARSHGCSVLEVWDEYRDRSVDPVQWVEERANAALEHVAGARVLLVTKSISSHTAQIAAERSLRGIWLTPLLVSDQVVEGLRRLDAQALLVGGGADELWDGELARSLGTDVLELQGADHSLQLPGDPLGSIEALRRVVERMDGFVAALEGAK